MRRVAGGDGDRALEHLLDLARSGVGAEPCPQLDPLRLSQRYHGQVEDHRVRDQDPVRSADQGGVEEAERADDSLQLSGQRPADQPHPVADPKGAGAEQHEAGEQVAERLLRREAEHDRGDGAADGERAGAKARDPERQRNDDDDRRSAGSGTRPCPRSPDPCGETAPGRSPGRAPGRAPSPGSPGRRRSPPSPASRGRGRAPRDDRRATRTAAIRPSRTTTLPAGPLGALAIDLGAEADLTPLLGPGFECVARPAKSSQSEHGKCIFPFCGPPRRCAGSLDLARTYTGSD